MICLTLAAGWLGAGCGGQGDPVRIGLLTECTGLVEPLNEPMTAGAEVPFIRRGARPLGTRPSEGITRANVAGRAVEIDQGCTETTEFHLIVSEVRRLVENDGVDIVIGPLGPTEALVLRKVARRYPNVTFLLGWAGGQEVTLRDPAPNVYRLTPNETQTVAGLGAYAYRTLGWRTAAIVAEDLPIGLTAAAGFTTEFCSLGGKIVLRDWTSLFNPDPPRGAVRQAAAADGVAVLSWVGSFSRFSPAPYLASLTRARPGPATRILLGGPTFTNLADLQWGVANQGVVVASDTPFQPNAEGREIARILTRSFPIIPPEAAENPAAVWYGEAGEAVARALEAARGDLGDGQKRFRAALSGLAFQSQSGPVRLDANRQAITTNYLGRVAGTGKAVSIREFGRITDVRQDYGGLFTGTSPSPSKTSPDCVRGTPPPWAR